ncbi:MAG: TIGR04190 family B12-binding domain/radical SAM domain protein [Chloroflexi bacterium]|nr:TIGR04190 family B12-binding domain/radical SAM domain protein [Chloroflexota bacterium]MBM3183012.1 TIGR04190 family B12-binding domain/radical SAM domain protein [Chloroflexota bacterium]MBM4453818.1 TIGR04190 family B12-binding domain/radical SAM domain protein [Chloroflexota bacterium]
MSTDLILLHAPSVYDFRQKTILYGPVSDLIPPSYVFEMYPIGLTSIADYLDRHGYRVRIVNLAVRMLRNRRFDAEAMIKRLNAPIFGIDLHWMLHCHGAIEIARLVKKWHPQSKLIFGGFSSTYFYKQLLERPEIDYVLRGDSTEEPFRQLMDCLKNGKEPESVPNLAWKDRQGRVHENPFSNVPSDIDNVMVNHYGNVVRSVIRYRDLISYTPVKDWLRYPITAVLTCRGCSENCVICGGSAAAFRRCYHRDKPAYRSPETVIRDIKQISRFSNGPIFVLGDLRQPGEDYATEVLSQLQKLKLKNPFILELFNPAPKELLQQMSRACPNFSLEISPESHDYEVRKAIGRNYTDEALEQTIADALDVGCGRLDIFYMIGLTKQTPQSALATIDYCDYLLKKFNSDKRLCLFTSPLAPFLDPGSLGFEQPERYGYRVLFRSLEEHRQALASPLWKYSLNFETKWMDRQQIMDTAYDAILRLNQVKRKHGVIHENLARISEQRLKGAWDMAHHIDNLLAQGKHQEIEILKPEVDKINGFPVAEKIQLEVTPPLMPIKPFHALWSVLTGK